MVRLTAIPEEPVDTRVGHAIATIGSNLPEMGRGVRELAAIMPDEHRAGDLVDAARKLCNAFGNFLDKVRAKSEQFQTKKQFRSTRKSRRNAPTSFPPQVGSANFPRM